MQDYEAARKIAQDEIVPAIKSVQSKNMRVKDLAYCIEMKGINALPPVARNEIFPKAEKTRTN